MARLEELERKFEENPRRYFAPLANEYRKAGDAAKAAELCRSQLPELPGHISGHIVLGQALFDSGDFAGARAALETALALDPENIVALRYLGDIARNTGDTAEAERWYSRTLEADPYNEAATQGLQGLQALRASEPAPEVPETSVDSAAQSAASETPPPAGLAEGFEPTAHAGELPPTAAPTQPAPEETVSSATGDKAPIAMDPVPPATEEIAPAESEELAATAMPTAVEDRSFESAEGEGLEHPAEIATAEAPPVAAPEPTVAEPAPEPGDEGEVEDQPGSEEFSGDLAISAASETLGESTEETQVDLAESLPADVTASDAEGAERAAEEPAQPDAIGTDSEVSQVAAEETAKPEETAVERFDVAAHEPAEESAPVGATEVVASDEAMQAEERVMESAAPFVTETMADLYLEQGYPHEALELLLQLAEQRPEDERLREKVAHIESVIAARRDAVVAAARAERAERTETAQAADLGAQTRATEEWEPIAASVSEQTVSEQEPAPPDAPFDAAVAEIDSSAFVDYEGAPDATTFEIPPFLPAEEEAPTTVREMFARMDRARPRPPSSVTPRPISRLRSDFVPLPGPGEPAAEPPGDPFAFPDAPGPEQRVPRTSGAQPTFNPSTADADDFEAWLRGRKGP